MATLYYFHDPMCSWCWGYRPTWQKLKAALPPEVKVENVAGGLAADSDEPMPEDLQKLIVGHWRHIKQELGTVFNFDFWQLNQPRRSTYVACRAVLLARRSGLEEAMIEAIQRAYYLRAMNPSDTDVLVKLAREIGLSEEDFRRDLNGEDVQRQLEEQIALSRAVNVSGFPSLMLQLDAEKADFLSVPIDYKDYQQTLDLIIQRL